MTDLDKIAKYRYCTLATKVCIVKATVLPFIIYGCASWTNTERREIITFYCGAGENCGFRITIKTNNLMLV